MNKAKIQEALDIIANELSSDETLGTDMAVYQIYTTANGFIAGEIKRIIKEEGEVMYSHPEIAPLFKFHEAILPVLSDIKNDVKETEKSDETKDSN